MRQETEGQLDLHYLFKKINKHANLKNLDSLIGNDYSKKEIEEAINKEIVRNNIAQLL